MTLRWVAILGVVLLQCACTERSSSDGGNSGDRPGNSGTVINFTTQCVQTNMLGGCDKRTCTADQDSDCSDYGGWCVEAGHKYEGTSEKGSCIRQHYEDLE
jgi:hypothetical protein